ncbi:Hypothetical protein NTJ_03319 [Nesidiocoris tenuis]|uniref:Uncharacterized protein n=1 Tax=Nesidiocoris tenuis TaxID=355587 RepID=A0ABN7AI02_9HEMI|nr:Hypothetical protein NTJ_03319 [Nesidiocoris tenuis]
MEKESSEVHTVGENAPISASLDSTRVPLFTTSIDGAGKWWGGGSGGSSLATRRVHLPRRPPPLRVLLAVVVLTSSRPRIPASGMCGISVRCRRDQLCRGGGA